MQEIRKKTSIIMNSIIVYTCSCLFMLRFFTPMYSGINRYLCCMFIVACYTDYVGLFEVMFFMPSLPIIFCWVCHWHFHYCYCTINNICFLIVIVLFCFLRLILGSFVYFYNQCLSQSCPRTLSIANSDKV